MIYGSEQKRNALLDDSINIPISNANNDFGVIGNNNIFKQ